mgnify:CR=1 FL=1
MSNQKYDIAVIGGGPGGYVAAIRAAQLGSKVALIEREHYGGICLNWGCIPTKSLLQSAERYTQIKNASSFGINVSNVSIDLKSIVARSRAISQKLGAGVRHLLKKNRVTTFDGHATLLPEKRISVTRSDKSEMMLHADNIIIATGARARSVSGLDIDRDYVWSYKEALVPEEIPQHLLVVGSGAIGMEFASFFLKLGAEVTVVEMLPKILPNEDDEISAYMEKSLVKQGMTILTSSNVAGIKRLHNSVEVQIERCNEKSTHIFDRIISAVGVVPNTEELGLERCGVQLDENGFIRTDSQGLTSSPGIYAIGDVAGAPCLAHKASHEGIVAAEVISGKTNHTKPTRDSIPGCTYCHPQVASIGLTEQRSKELGLETKIGRFPYSANGKAMAMEESEGLIKAIFDARSGELLGAHMVGAEVTEMIQGFGIAKSLETTEAELMNTVFAHPTLSEMMHEAVLDAYERALHIHK